MKENVFNEIMENEGEYRELAKTLVKEGWNGSILPYATDFAVDLMDNEWYDNIPFFYAFEDSEGNAWLSLENSEDCFYEEMNIDDPENEEEVYEVLVQLTEFFLEYISNIDDKTIEDCQEEGSCCINDFWKC